MSALEALAANCQARGWRVGLAADTHRAPLQLAYLEVRGQRGENGKRELLARSPVTFFTLDQACAEIAVSLDRQGLLTP